tara:strand:+ start:1182 stop:1301 length:120 start_codon:yes stop_codon:yes gene_type:complete
MTISEEISPADMKKIRELIRKEIAEVYFSLYRKRAVWGA